MERIRKLYEACFNICEICYHHGVGNVILSPGSRSAPLAISFLRHRKITPLIIPDERSAGYMAIGMTQQSDAPVALVSTSGTAALNYAPAVAEAFFQKIPLVVFTSDRPPEWIEQGANQTIFQTDLYGKHVKKSYTFPARMEGTEEQWEISRKLNRALNICSTPDRGPVHLNCPFREPFYPGEEDLTGSSSSYIFKEVRSTSALPEKEWDTILQELRSKKKIMIAGGANPPSAGLTREIEKLSEVLGAVFIPGIVSNQHGVQGSIFLSEQIVISLKGAKKQALQPDLVITFGGDLVSKPFRNFLREFSSGEHWHIQPSGKAPDTFQKLKKIIPLSPEVFFQSINERWKDSRKSSAYRDAWNNREDACSGEVDRWLEKEPLNEVSALMQVLKEAPGGSVIQLGNSLPVRHAALLSGKLKNKGFQYFSNRGTSGIDGCLSTAVGFAGQSDKTVVVILGDMAFFYDRNALWRPSLPPNLKIVVLNNHGGGIFRTIEGPSLQPELEQYFVARREMNFAHTAWQSGCMYKHCSDWEALKKMLPVFFQRSEVPFVLELEFEDKQNFRALKNLKDSLRSMAGR